MHNSTESMTMSQPMNLLFIYTDEQAAATLAAYGNYQIEMPNLNRFAERATVFEKAYVVQPVCTPSRSCLLSGLWPHLNGCERNNIPLAADIPAVPEMLPANVYHTSHIGKWHLGDEIFLQHGFDEWVSLEDNYIRHYSEGRDREARSSYHEYLIKQGYTPQNGSHFSRGETARFPEADGKPAFLAGEACAFLERNRDRPFALYVNFLEPHMPYFGPRDDQYDPESISLPESLHAEHTGEMCARKIWGERYYHENGHSGLSLRTDADWRQMIANYWGLCSLIDTHVGRILDRLEKLGLAENTMVVFTSDHGDMAGAHGLVAKSVMYEESVTVPLMIRMPGQTASRRITGPFSHVDLVPTILETMGCALPDHLSGQSRAAYLHADGPIHLNEYAVVEWNGFNSDEYGRTTGYEQFLSEEQLQELKGFGRTIISPDGWKLNWRPTGVQELYDLKTDPHECHNRYRDSSCQGKRDELIRQLRSWQEANQDTLML